MEASKTRYSVSMPTVGSHLPSSSGAAEESGLDYVTCAICEAVRAELVQLRAAIRADVRDEFERISSKQRVTMPAEQAGLSQEHSRKEGTQRIDDSRGVRSVDNAASSPSVSEDRGQSTDSVAAPARSGLVRTYTSVALDQECALIAKSKSEPTRCQPATKWKPGRSSLPASWFHGATQEVVRDTMGPRQAASAGASDKTLPSLLESSSKEQPSCQQEGISLPGVVGRQKSIPESVASEEAVTWTKGMVRNESKNIERTARSSPLDTKALHSRNKTNSSYRTKSKARSYAEVIATSQCFEVFIMTMIFANSVMVGVQTHYMAVEKTDTVPTHFRMIDLIYMVICCAEVMLRIYVHRCAFFFMMGWMWNVFDLSLVVGQVLEELLLLLQATGAFSDAGIANSLSILSIVRLLRALRVVRVLRVLQRQSSLRLIVSCILYSVRPLFWSAVIIAAMTYINAIYVTQLVTASLVSLEEENMDEMDEAHAVALQQLYGSLAQSALSLFQAITGGLDWNDLVQPLFKLVSPWTGLLVLFYIGFALLAVMNVVTGLFVENAMERAQEVRQLNIVAHARRVFESLDLDTSGSISYEELKTHMHSPVVQAYFKVIDIHISEAKCLFEMLDTDGSGAIDFEEFMHGCLRLQGPARAVDLLLSSRESKLSFRKTLRALQGLQAALAK